MDGSGKLNTKNIKVRKDKEGKRYVRIKGYKFGISDNVTESKLVPLIHALIRLIKNLRPRRRKGAKREKKAIGKPLSKEQPTIGYTPQQVTQARINHLLESPQSPLLLEGP